MIIVNGEISAKSKTGGGLDENGNPVRPSSEWGKPIPCRISVNKRNNLGKQNGNSFTIASFEILIEPQPFIDDGMVKLRYLSGRELGEFPIMFPPEFLEAVGAVKIVV
ncbi:MAG: hypothetical protein LBH60_04885 [Prevotellaceae bacterium]|nr:hypothetical protein [Prevotellaceae bacterium]